jgi:hypothetical protein
MLILNLLCIFIGSYKLVFPLKYISVPSGSDANFANFESPVHFYLFIQIGFSSGYSRTAGSFTFFRHSHSGNKCSVGFIRLLSANKCVCFLFEAF